MNETNPVPAGTKTKTRFLGMFGGASSGIGAVGAACHYSCQAIVALLALAGISLAGMPLAFLADPRLVVAFSAVGLASVAVGVLLHRRMRSGFDRKIAVFALFGVVSAVSLGVGVRDLVGTQNVAMAAEVPALSVDERAKTSEAGDATIEISYEGLSNEELMFRVAMDVMRMDLPPLTAFDLKRLAVLMPGGGGAVKPSRWQIEDEGHMGHHVRGVLVFPVPNEALLDGRTKSFKVVLNDVAGAKERTFVWKIVSNED